MNLEVGRVLVKKGDAAHALPILEEALHIFEGLAKSAPESSYLADNFGNAYSELGMAHARLAADTKLPQSSRQEHWKQARSWDEKSLAIWLDLKSKGKLASDDAAEPDRLRKEIAHCDRALARL